jgi:uncharacterized membrane protein
MVFVVESVVEIDRGASEVFAFVADMTNAPRWQAGLHSVRRTTPGPVRVGSEHVFERRFAGRTLASRNRITDYDPPRRIGFEIPEGWISGRASYQVVPIGARSRVTCRMEFAAAGPLRLVEPVLARILDRDSRRDDQRLKALLEGQPTEVPPRTSVEQM